MKNEIWKDIVGQEEKYQVSNQGRVRRIYKSGSIKILSPKMSGKRQTVRIRKQKGCDYSSVIVANLVADAFIPRDYEWQDYVEHIDGNTQNNAVHNLKWSYKKNKEIINEYSRRANLKGKNKFYIKNNVVYVELNNTHQVMICDIDDWQKHKNHTWNEHSGYAKAKYGGKEVPFHRIIMNCPEGYIVDHINRNRFDNRKCNLRITTQYANSLNRTVSKLSKTQNKGIYKEGNKYRAYITVNKKRHNLGVFNTIDEAIKARKEAEDKLFKPIIDRETIKSF